MKHVKAALVYGFFVLLSTQTHADVIDVQAGKEAFETCRGCHSLPGYSNVYPTYYIPKIGGQRTAYIISALTAYKNETRPRTSMLANAANLSEDSIKNIAAYIEVSTTRKAKAPFTGDPATGKKLAEACLGCHTTDLKDGLTAPILAGQYGNYLVKAMKDYQSGKRESPLMQSMLTGLTEENLEDISSYFANMKSLSSMK